MGFKKIRYGTGEEIVELKIRDTTGAEISKWVVMISDFPRVFDIMKKKFNLSSSSHNKDLDWAR